MARKNNGGFGGRVLNMIGLVDDQEPQDTYEDEYENGNYGRQQAYTPRSRSPRTQPTRSRQSAPARREYAPSFEPTRPQRSSTRDRGSVSRFDQPQRSASTSASARRFDAASSRMQTQQRGYDYSPRASRFAAPEEDYNAGYADTDDRNPRSGNGRTIMFSLRSLDNCRDVIDNLIMNTTVVLTLDNLDPTTTQRAIDTLSGAVFALHATICKASASTYLLAPKGVQVNETYETDRYF